MAKRLISFSLRLAIMGLLILALLDVAIPASSFRTCRILLLDLSDSLHGHTGDRGARLDAMLSHLPAFSSHGLSPEDWIGLVTFARGTSVEQPPLPRSRFALPTRLNSHLDPTETDTAEALATCFALFPDHTQREIILFSDGRLTGGSLEDLILAARTHEVTIHTVPVGSSDPRDVRIMDLTGPTQVAPGTVFDVTLFLTSTYDTAANVSIEREGATLASREITLVKNTTTSLSFSNLSITEEAPHQRFVARCRPLPREDDYPQNNQYSWDVSRKEDRPTVLFLHRDPPSSSSKRILDRSGRFQIHASKTMQDPFAYDAVLLDDFDVTRVPHNQLALLRRYVDEGGGALLILGGPTSFALGGYQDTPLEEVMPVWAAPDETLSLVVLIDRSGSMGETLPRSRERKWDMAVQAVESSVKILASRDHLALATFADKTEIVSPLQSLSHHAPPLNRLRSTAPGGSTHLLDAVHAGLKQIQEARTGRRHLLLITDGQDTSGAPIEEFARLKSELDRQQVSLTIIATGESIDEERLRALAGDRYSHEQDMKKLEDRLKQDIIRQKAFVHTADRPLDVRVKDPTPWTSDLGPIPPVARCNNTTPKEQAQVLLTADGVPLAAQRSFGRGMSTVLTSNLYEEWTPEWRSWEKASSVVVHLLSSMIRPRQRLAIQADHRNAEGTMILTFSSPSEPIERVEYINPQAGHQGTLTITPKGFGQYEAILTDARAGTYYIKISGSASEVKYTATVPYSSEFEHVGIHLETLKALAEGTGGRMIFTPSGLTVSDRPVTQGTQSGRTLFLLTAVAMFLLDLVLATFWKAKS